MKWFRRRAATAAQPRADRTQIALLEHELFGIEPEPHSAAAFVIDLQRAFGLLDQQLTPGASDHGCAR